MTFDDLITRRPNIILADLIQLFLLGYDDKIYVDIFVDGIETFEHIRIIDSKLVPYYEYKIEYLTDPCGSLIGIALKED